jgi:hypothetical protein
MKFDVCRIVYAYNANCIGGFPGFQKIMTGFSAAQSFIEITDIALDRKSVNARRK